MDYQFASTSNGCKIESSMSSVNEFNDVDESPEPILPNNERQLFGQLVAAALEKLSERDAVSAMMDMQTIITKYRLASLPEK